MVLQGLAIPEVQQCVYDRKQLTMSAPEQDRFLRPEKDIVYVCLRRRVCYNVAK